MLVKFSDPGIQYIVECEAVSVERGDSASRVRLSRDGQDIYDALIAPRDEDRRDGVICYSRAYIMENGATVDVVK